MAKLSEHPLHSLDGKEFHHQELSLQQLRDHRCKWSLHMLWLLEGEKDHGVLRFFKEKGEDARILPTKFRDQYCWLCDTKIELGAEIAWLPKLALAFHSDCWNRP